MRVTKGDSTIVDARSKAEAADDILTEDYYAQLQQIRLSVDATGRYERADRSTEVILDGTDVSRLVECALKHPNPQMRHLVLAAVWNDPQAFRQIFRFGLEAPEAFSEIRKIVAEELDKWSGTATDAGQSAAKALLPRMPLPAHLQDRGRK
jgi:hypothetical protein